MAASAPPAPPVTAPHIQGGCKRGWGSNFRQRRKAGTATTTAASASRRASKPYCRITAVIGIAAADRFTCRDIGADHRREHPRPGQLAARSRPRSQPQVRAQAVQKQPAHTRQFGHQKATQGHLICIRGHTLPEPSSKQIRSHRPRRPTQARSPPSLAARSVRQAAATRSGPHSQPQAEVRAVLRQHTRA